MSNFTHTMSDEHDAFFRTAFKLEEGPELPDQILERYWTVKKLADRVTVALSTNDLLWIALSCGYTLPGEKPQTYLDLVRSKAVQLDDPVTALFRNRWRVGVYKGLDSDNRILVVFKNSADERSIDPKNVRVGDTHDLTNDESAVPVDAGELVEA